MAIKPQPAPPPAAPDAAALDSSAAEIPHELTVLPTHDGVLFPGMGLPALIGGQPMLGALEAAMTANAPVAIVAQRPDDSKPDEPKPDEPKPGGETDQPAPETAPSPDSLFRIGTAARIARLVPGPAGGV